MKSILLTAMLAVAGFASKVPVVSYTNQATPWDFGLSASTGFAQAYYDINFGYALESAFEQGDTDGVMDAWIQAAIYSNCDLYFNLNLYNLDVFNVKINIVPFHFIPTWASLYFTHPAAVAKGVVDSFAAAVDFGYEFHTGEVAVQYYTNSLVPKVSLSDIALSGSQVYYPEQPGSTYLSNAAGVNGWDWNVDPNNAWVEEPFLKFDLLEWLISEGKVEVDNYASYAFIPLINNDDYITPAQ